MSEIGREERRKAESKEKPTQARPSSEKKWRAERLEGCRQKRNVRQCGSVACVRVWVGVGVCVCVCAVCDWRSVRVTVFRCSMRLALHHCIYLLGTLTNWNVPILKRSLRL